MVGRDFDAFHRACVKSSAFSPVRYRVFLHLCSLANTYFDRVWPFLAGAYIDEVMFKGNTRRRDMSEVLRDFSSDVSPCRISAGTCINAEADAVIDCSTPWSIELVIHTSWSEVPLYNFAID